MNRKELEKKTKQRKLRAYEDAIQSMVTELPMLGGIIPSELKIENALNNLISGEASFLYYKDILNNNKRLRELNTDEIRGKLLFYKVIMRAGYNDDRFTAQLMLEELLIREFLEKILKITRYYGENSIQAELLNLIRKYGYSLQQRGTRKV